MLNKLQIIKQAAPYKGQPEAAELLMESLTLSIRVVKGKQDQHREIRRVRIQEADVKYLAW